MHSKTFTLVALAALVLGSFLPGCASSEDDDPQAGDESNLTQAAPSAAVGKKVEAIRAIVAEVDRSKLRQEQNVGCDGTTTKFTDGAGKIRKLSVVGGEGESSTNQVAYYDTRGELRFLRSVEVSHTGRAKENRVYLESNAVIFQAVRDLTDVKNDNPDFSKARDRLPTHAESYGPRPLEAHRDPAAWFKGTGCGEDTISSGKSSTPGARCGGPERIACPGDQACEFDVVSADGEPSPFGVCTAAGDGFPPSNMEEDR
jgi:hypothetical protein